MKVKLLHYTPLEVADIAICKCYANTPHSEEEKRLKRIRTVANQNKHASVIEHLVYSFDIDGVSRALLQEDARHRIGSMTVKSTRYTLQELKNEKPFKEDNNGCILSTYKDRIQESYDRASKYLVYTGENIVDWFAIDALENLRRLIACEDVPNDKAKYCLPEAYKTSYVRTFNARSLQNFLSLRTDRKALWEIQLLAKAMFDVLPESHKPLFEEFINAKN
ncbi:MAG TPA: FAD-dependent thymidylate synthase [Bacteroidales bacterium]|nr:FAD-dependent thymidylate synthase [Bacteroidales bacterium]